jgi:probable F420-dependent oxidoreductase
MTKPFRFGVQAQKAADGKAWRDQARQVEDLGYSTLWIPDHFGEQWGPIASLTAAADATTTLRVGALVFDNDYRHPGVLAKEMATLDILSDGRMEFGIGAGWMKSDYEEYGIPYDPPGVRIDRMIEGLDIIKQMWTTGTANHQGTHYRYTNAHGEPRPVQQPHPPVLIGGGGKRVLTYAARNADIVGFNTKLTSGYAGPEAAAEATAAKFAERLQWVKDAAADAGRGDSLEFQCWVGFCFVDQDRTQIAEMMAPTFGLSPDDALQIPIVMAGTADEIAETLQQRREQFGFSYWCVPGDAYEQMAPIVAKLAGT